MSKVYSTEKKICRKCGEDPCLCRAKKQSRSTGPVRVIRETKGRKGAGVTYVTGLNMSETDLRRLLSEWKKNLGCGGSLRGGVLELQGDHREVLLAELAALGISAKRSGG
jgi:translation initiation factor 1